MRTQAIIEAVRILEPADTEHLREIIISHVVYCASECDDRSEVGDHLLGAYTAGRSQELEEEEKALKLVSGDEAWQEMKRLYILGHQDGLREKLPKDYYDESFSWPECGITWKKDGMYPAKIIGAIGYAIGYHDAKVHKALRDMAQAGTEVEAE